jgi:hypothetical protein
MIKSKLKKLRVKLKVSMGLIMSLVSTWIILGEQTGGKGIV